MADADAQAALVATAKEIKWDGTALGTLGTYGNVGGVVNTPNSTGTASPALANGQYSLWGYLRLGYRTTLSTDKPDAYTAEQAILARLRTVDSQVLLQDVNIHRVAPDGGQIQQGQLAY